MSGSSCILNSSDSEPEISEEMSEENEASSSENENNDIPGKMSLNVASPNEEIFSFDTRGPTAIAKKKPRLENCKRSSATGVSRVAATSKRTAQRPQPKSVATSSTLTTPSPRLTSSVHRRSHTVPRRPEMMLPGNTPTTTKKTGGKSSSSQVPVTPENPAKQTGAREEDHPMSSVLGEISNMLSTAIKRLEKLNQS